MVLGTTAGKVTWEGTEKVFGVLGKTQVYSFGCFRVIVLFPLLGLCVLLFWK